MKINIVYWSGTGNTEEMAKLIAGGASESGAEVKVDTVDKWNEEDALNCDLLLLGSPAMGAEVIEEAEMEPFMESIEGKIGGKDIILFGSYGWGTGEWMTIWEDRVESAGANLVERDVIANEMPEGADSDKLVELGRKIGK